MEYINVVQNKTFTITITEINNVKQINNVPDPSISDMKIEEDEKK
jgi:hypothetical protein